MASIYSGVQGHFKRHEFTFDELGAALVLSERLCK